MDEMSREWSEIENLYYWLNIKVCKLPPCLPLSCFDEINFCWASSAIEFHVVSSFKLLWPLCQKDSPAWYYTRMSEVNFWCLSVKCITLQLARSSSTWWCLFFGLFMVASFRLYEIRTSLCCMVVPIESRLDYFTFNGDFAYIDWSNLPLFL